MIFKKALLAGLAIVFFTGVGDSTEKQDKNEKDDTGKLQYSITVTANRIKTSVKEVAPSVTIITREEMEAAGKTSVLEALQDVIGITLIQNGPPGAESSIFIRGANSNHTKVMLDGMDINDPMTPSRSTDISHMLIESIDRIEIIRGPQSTLYGSDAMAGVINIITRRGAGKPRLQIHTQGGSYQTLSSRVEFSGSSQKISYSLGTSFFRTKGYSASSSQYPGNTEADGHKNLSLSGKIGLQLSNSFDLHFMARHINSSTDIDNFGGPYGDDPNNRQNYRALVLSTQARALLFKNRWEQKINLSAVDYSREYTNPTDSIHPLSSDHSTYKSRMWKLDWQHNLFLSEAHTLTFGIESLQEHGESEFYSDNPWGPYSTLFPRETTHNTGVYFQDQVKMAGRFFATIGIRYDRHSQTDPAMTFRLAPAYLIPQTGTKLKATLGTGFKAPSLFQLYDSLFGNQDLKPEKSTGWDCGIEQYLFNDKMILSATYFSNHFRNLIDWSYSGYFNLGKAHSKGIELSLSMRPAESIRLHINYTRLNAREKDNEEPLIRRPKDKFFARCHCTLSNKATFTITMTYVGKREDQYYVDFSTTRVRLPGYFLLSATSSLNVGSHSQLYLHLDNILNQEYEVIKGYGTSGFSIYGGIKITL